jgi:tRNA-2-methylthio-N6-dimethylallyladenosine synthase
VLVENKMEKQNKLFGRNKYISPVIFDGNDSNIGRVVKVKVKNSNQHTLFGSLDKKMKAA